MNLNQQQKLAVSTREGKHILLAGAGAGKTSTIIERFKALVSSGVHSSEILCLTFTANAAENMSRRTGSAKDSFRTFHSFGYFILNSEKGRVPVEPELRHRLLSKLCRQYGLDYKLLAATISILRAMDCPADAEKVYGYPMVKAFREYEQERLLAGWLDFDSMLIDSVRLLENPDVRPRYQRKFVMVDEAQDTCPLQHHMADLVTEEHGNLMIVGDPNQAIYQWRGASPERLLDPEENIICLGTNYRSTSTIVKYIKTHTPVKSPLTDAMQAPPEAISGDEIEYRMYPSDLAEAEATVAAAQKDPLNSMILARTNRLLAPFENLMLGHGIKYNLLGSSGFFKQSEVRKVIERLGQYKHVPPEAATRLVVGQVSEFYKVEDATKEDNEALANLKILANIAKKFQTTSEFIKFAIRAAHAKKTKGITLGTIHSAKGLEAQNVFLVGCREGVMPHQKGIPEEEARIFYVAISRAAKKLRISFTGSPSEYVRAELTPQILLTMKENYNRVERLTQQTLLFEETNNGKISN